MHALQQPGRISTKLPLRFCRGECLAVYILFIPEIPEKFIRSPAQSVGLVVVVVEFKTSHVMFLFLSGSGTKTWRAPEYKCCFMTKFNFDAIALRRLRGTCGILLALARRKRLSCSH